MIHARGNVRYFDGNDLEYFQDVKGEPVHTAFWKRKKYSYQQEFRILIDKSIEDHYILNIGDISDISETTRKLLDCQLHDGSDAEVQLLQNELKQQYTAFKAQYGLINSTANKRAFRQDSSYCLLASLEILDEEKNLKRLADIFTKRTIRKPEPVTSVDTPSEALALSIGEKRTEISLCRRL